MIFIYWSKTFFNQRIINQTTYTIHYILCFIFLRFGGKLIQCGKSWEPAPSSAKTDDHTSTQGAGWAQRAGGKALNEVPRGRHQWSARRVPWDCIRCDIAMGTSSHVLFKDNVVDVDLKNKRSLRDGFHVFFSVRHTVVYVCLHGQFRELKHMLESESHSITVHQKRVVIGSSPRTGSLLCWGPFWESNLGWLNFETGLTGSFRVDVDIVTYLHIGMHQHASACLSGLA